MTISKPFSIKGACSDTMNHDGLYMMDNNYQYTLDLLDWCQDERIPFLYASSAAVYGKGEIFREERELENHSMCTATLNSCLTKYCAAA